MNVPTSGILWTGQHMSDLKRERMKDSTD